MKNYRRFTIVALALLSLSACTDAGSDEVIGAPPATEETQPEDTMQTDEGPKLIFDLPEGWERHPETQLKARWNEPPEGSVLPFVLLEVMTWKKGTPQDARAMAEEHFQKQTVMEGEPPTMQEASIAGLTAYVIELHTNSYWGDWWWNTDVIFEKDGYIGSLSVSDRYETQKEVIEKVIGSFRMN